MKKRIAKVLSGIGIAACATLLVGWSMTPNIIDLQLPSDATMEKGSAECLAIEFVADKDDISSDSIIRAAEKLSLTWSSSNEAVASVDENGKVTAHKPGEATISVQANESELSAICNVEVEVTATDIVVPERMTLTVNGEASQELKASIQPEDATDVKVTYTSSDESIATVDENGKVSGIADGQCVVTTKVVSTEESEKDYEVIGSTIVTVEVAPKTLSLTDSSIYVGNSTQLNVAVDPEEVSVGKEFTWSSSDEKIATVDENGKVKGIAVGSATITVTNELGQSAESTVTVKAVPVVVKPVVKEEVKAESNSESDKTTVSSDKEPAKAPASSGVTSGATNQYYRRYSDETGTITIYREWYKNAWVYSAHLEFSDYKRFGTACANGAYGAGVETTSHAANRLGAIFAVNGCYSAPKLNYSVARSGVVCNRGNDSLWVPAVYSNNNGKLLSAWETNGTKGIAGKQLNSLVSSGKVTDTFCFGPGGLVNGKNLSKNNTGRAQRTFIGTNGKAGDIWLFVSEGRYVDGVSAGLTYMEMNDWMISKGCTFGVPLDGGGSSTMVFNGEVLNSAAGNQRAVVDFVYFK